MKFFMLSALILSTATAMAAPRASQDCGLIQGLAVAADTLAANEGPGRSDIGAEGMLALFELNRSKADHFSSGLGWAAGQVERPWLGHAFGDIRATVDSQSAGGNGGHEYWLQRFIAQQSVFQSALDRLHQLQRQICGE